MVRITKIYSFIKQRLVGVPTDIRPRRDLMAQVNGSSFGAVHASNDSPVGERGQGDGKKKKDNVF